MFVTWNYGIYKNKTQKGLRYKLVDRRTEKVIAEGYGKEALEQIRKKKTELEEKKV